MTGTAGTELSKKRRVICGETVKSGQAETERHKLPVAMKNNLTYILIPVLSLMNNNNNSMCDAQW